MTTNLPPFDELKRLAEQDPEQLEQLRRDMIEQVITSASPDKQQRLRGLQFRIDMEMRKHSNPLGSCVAISRMMRDSVDQLIRAIADGHNTDLQAETKRVASVVDIFKPKEK